MAHFALQFSVLENLTVAKVSTLVEVCGHVNWKQTPMCIKINNGHML